MVTSVLVNAYEVKQDKSLLNMGCCCTGMICKINPSLYLQNSDHSPSVQFPNLSIMPGKCDILENKAQISFCKACSSRQCLAERSTRCAIVHPAENLRGTEIPMYCRNSCLSCISCRAALSESELSAVNWTVKLQVPADMYKMLRKTSDLSESTCRASVTNLTIPWHPNYRRAAMGSYWIQSTGW